MIGNRLKRSAYLGVALFFAGIGVAKAGDMPDLPAASEWQGDLTLYGWYGLPSGQLGVRGYGPWDIPSNSNTNILDVLNGFFMATGELKDGRFGILGDFLWADFGERKTGPKGFLSASVGLSGAVGTAAGTYTLLQSDVGNLEALAGVRVWGMDASADFTTAGGISRSVDHELTWFDPLVGLKGRYLLSPDWFLSGAAAIGGFGAGSKFMYDANAVIGYNFNDHISASLGYRVIGVDYRRNGTIIDAVMHGPVAGLTARF